jgi:hypothetical protein
MATMTVRTTVAFDPASVARLERLAKRWGVSKSEALRRALERAELAVSQSSAASSLPALGDISAMTPADALSWLQSHSLVDAEQGAEWRGQLQQTREDFATRP